MFAPWFPPHRNSEGIVNGKLALAFLKAGWGLDVIYSRPVELPKEAEEVSFWAPLAGVSYSVPKKYPGSLGRMINRVSTILRTGHMIKGLSWVQYAVKKAEALSRLKHYDVILSRSFPVQVHLAALLVAGKSRIPWVANWNEVEPGNRNPYPYGEGIDAPMGYFIGRFLREIWTKADRHTFPSERAMRYMSSYMPGIGDKTSIIPHIALERTGESSNSLMRAHEKFTICHAGIFDGRRNPGPFFDALSRLCEKTTIRRDLVVKLLGYSYDGANKPRVPENLQEIVTIQDWCNYEETLRELSQADVLLLIEGMVEEGIFLSGKFIDYVQCRKPILALSPTVGTVNDVMRVHGGGIVVDCSDASQIATALERLYRVWQQNRLGETYPTQGLLNLYGESTVIRLYKALFDRLGI